ncbi:histidinol phosphate aminotransferase apoenzyme [Pseudarcicella hirudinis]|uniref:Histidinol-phosphate aminotransferase n=1 Tax=Pseudarcicella hirudinis TaxID=1079859 RepID=A0A1I5WA07_9BACT|nr:histidinol-phosphate transaminase [Pseudarcicella hirudinis]SFQ16529.1 histidinol phosphate aminotransferase apoenzyme [Pseudarcicella hirudinis]
MSFNLDKVLRPHIAGLAPYSSARDEYTGKEGIFLDANENPLGSATPENWNRYPDPYQTDIKVKLAAIKGCRPSQIFLGNGSDEPIDLIIRATCTPKEDNIIILPPTYGMYEVSASINDVEIKKVPLTTDYQLDVDNILKAVTPYTKLIFICSPNNPTGNLIEKKSILRILESFSQGIVILDEAYNDFAEEPSFIAELDQYPNLLILQTFSKAWGLAALRLGMAFAGEEIVKILNKIKPPYNINGLTQKLLIENIDNLNFVKESVTILNDNRLKLVEALEKLPFVLKVYPSDANFILVKFTDSKAVFEYLIAHKTIVRDRSKVVLCDSSLRISVGTQEENKTLISLLEQFS